MDGETLLSEVESTTTSEAMQTEMQGDFFAYDDGLGAVVDQNGNPFSKEDGKYYQSENEYKDFLKQQAQPKPQGTQKPAQPNTAQPMQQQGNANAKIQQGNGFDSFYKKDSAFDVTTLISDSPKFNSFNYERQINPVQQQNNGGLAQQPAQTEVPVDPKVADANTLKEYRENMEAGTLKPIERAYQKSLAAYNARGEQMPQDVYDAFNAEYTQLKAAIDDQVLAKREELVESRYKSKEEENSYKAMEKTSLENFTKIAGQYFPNLAPDVSKDRLEKLLFGYSDGTKFVKGYGADAIDHAFDLAHDGKQFKNVQEFEAAYTKWWNKYASNPKNIALIAKNAWNSFIASNLDGMRDGFRQTWEQEQKNKLKQTQQNPYATRGGGNSLGTDSAQAQLNSYFTPPSRNM